MSEDNGQNRSWLERLSNVLLREPQDRQQLVDLLRDAEERDLLDADALTMIEGVLQVSDKQVRDIMIPRAQMVVIEKDARLEEFLPEVIESAHSRFPVVGDSRDDVLGILLAKDLLSYTFQVPTKPTSYEKFDINRVLRPVVFVPESKRLNVLLQDFRQSHNHMAIVVDEYGGVAGLVTIEDVLEQIVGEIEDEYDVDEDAYIKILKPGHYIVKALTPVEDFNRYFHSEFSDEEFDTVGGLVMQAFGYLPKRGESITIGDFECKVLHADQRRIKLLRVLKSEEIK